MYIVQSSEFMLPQTIHVYRQGIIACNNNNMRNPTKYNVAVTVAFGSSEPFHLENGRVRVSAIPT